MSNILEQLTNQMRSTLDSALSLALHNKNQEVQPIHIIWALLTNSGSILHQVLNKMNTDKAAIELETKSQASKLPAVSTITKENIKLSHNLIRSLEVAQGLMNARGDKFLAVDSWLIANSSESFFKDIFGKYLDISEFKKSLESIRGGKSIDSQSGDETLEALNQYGIDLTQKALMESLTPSLEEMKRCKG